MLIGCTGFLPGFLLGNVDEDWWIVQLTRVGISSCFFFGCYGFSHEGGGGATDSGSLSVPLIG